MRIPSVMLLIVLLGTCLLWQVPEAAVFGNQTLETSLLNTENQITCGRFSPSSDGTLDSITVYLDISGFGEEGAYGIRMAIYNYNSGTPTPLVDSTVQYNISFPASDLWLSRAVVIGAAITSGTTYDICVWSSSDPTEGISVRMKSGLTGNYVDYDPETWGVWPSTLTESTLNNYRMSIYATYTEGGGEEAGATPARRRRMLIMGNEQ